MDKKYYSPEIEFVEFDDRMVTEASECDFDCLSNCSCYSCVGVCTWDCKADDSTCTTGDYNPGKRNNSSKKSGSSESPKNPVGFDQRFF